MIKNVGKRGDTLVEVMLAVGIFSMVAVAVVSVMSGGTNSSQTALETTLTREEIDNQAEALRFIHKAYVADVKNGTNSRYGTLWKDITDNAANANLGNNDSIDPITQYRPATCDELYNGTIASQKGFVINTQQIEPFVHSTKDNPSTSQVIVRDVSTNHGSGNLTPASTYPHLIFGGSADTSTELIERGSTATGGNSTLYGAEGIYVVAVKDPNSTTIANKSHADKIAYYDFYIRTCWYGTGDQSPSTISTVMRLYNPDINAVN